LKGTLTATRLTDSLSITLAVRSRTCALKKPQSLELRFRATLGREPGIELALVKRFGVIFRTAW
jgi:hypothetical protein